MNSCHHQAICRLAPGLSPMAVSQDGVIEAVYMPDKSFIWGVQWHPEMFLEDAGFAAHFPCLCAGLCHRNCGKMKRDLQNSSKSDIVREQFFLKGENCFLWNFKEERLYEFCRAHKENLELFYDL